MFLVRTAFETRGTTCPSTALSYLREMATNGRTPTVQRLSGRRMSTVELEVEVRAARGTVAVCDPYTGLLPSIQARG